MRFLLSLVGFQFRWHIFFRCFQQKAKFSIPPFWITSLYMPEYLLQHQSFFDSYICQCFIITIHFIPLARMNYALSISVSIVYIFFLIGVPHKIYRLKGGGAKLITKYCTNISANNFDRKHRLFSFYVLLKRYSSLFKCTWYVINPCDYVLCLRHISHGVYHGVSTYLLHHK